MSKTTPVIKPIDPIVGPGVSSGILHFIISARDLPMRDRGMLPGTVQDPYIKWSVKDNKSSEFVEAGKTSWRQNNPNPDWFNEVFSFEWYKGQGQIWHFEVMDKDLNKDDAVGFADVDVDAYVLQKKQQLSVKLSSSQGTLLLQKTQPISIRLSAQNLPRLDAFNGPSDPYVKCFWSFGADGPKTEFGKTATIKNVDNAEWDEAIVFGSYQPATNQYMTFEVYDKDPLPSDDHIGTVSIDVDHFVKSKKEAVLHLSHGKSTIDLCATLTVKQV